MEEKNFIWQKILWSVVFIFASVLLAYVNYRRSNSIISFGVFPYYIWPYVTVPSIVLILLRLTKRGISRSSFIFLFAGTANAFIGSTGVYSVSMSDTQLGIPIHAMFYLNLLLAVFIFFGAFRNK